MNKYKQHIVILLCLIFAFPQINNAVHYFWTEHTFHYTAEKRVVFGEKHHAHNCELHIFKIPAITAISFFSFTPFIPVYPVEKPFRLIKKYGSQTLFSCFLRGPPAV
ncbi:hypothetical protein E6C50_11720 [Flavobacterium supellecticarium]|uniref:Uncharacterized protein n=1 Tax=Flavobacterium supellecticarium TaxID=2565924 RepID=A0A4V3W806_9FLAO|nr:hypothetical protein [Flavobacterium supellecticarium]THF49413.1 hypothetical protein E6C50_11720 [Flavobacterium supellecticarium]